MSEPTRATGEQRQRISDELRQLKQMSKGLRSRALRTLMERNAAQRLTIKPVVLPVKSVVLPPKAPPSVAA